MRTAHRLARGPARAAVAVTAAALTLALAGPAAAATSTPAPTHPGLFRPLVATAPRTTVTPAAAASMAATPTAAPSAAPGGTATATATATGTAGSTPSGQPAAGGTDVVTGLPVATVDPQQALALQYQTLSSALVDMYAQRSGTSLPAFLSAHGTQVGAAIGTGDLAPLAGAKVSSLSQLSASMSSNNLGVPAQAFGDLSTLAAQVNAKANTPDAQVVTAGTRWAQQMAALRAPELLAPKVSAPGAPAVPANALVFGAFLDKSLTHLVANFPDVFSQVQSSGINNPQSLAAWNSSMLAAVQASKSDLATSGPNACLGSVLSVAASGDPASASAGCGSTCVSAGLYAHQKLDSVVSPLSNTTMPNPLNGVIPPSGWAQLQDWQRTAIEQQNPQLSQQLASQFGSANGASLSGCGAVSAGVGKAASTTLDGVLAQLGN